MPVCASGGLVCSLSLLIRGSILAAVRQKLHLALCSDLRGQLCIETFALDNLFLYNYDIKIKGVVNAALPSVWEGIWYL
jgi:hypothetical protein